MYIVKMGEFQSIVITVAIILLVLCMAAIGAIMYYDEKDVISPCHRELPGFLAGKAWRVRNRSMRALSGHWTTRGR